MALSLACELAETVPSVSANPFSLEEVLVNLLTNARDAVLACGAAPPPPPILLRTLSTCRQGHERTEIQVIDKGIGIPEMILGKVFEPFFTTKGPNQGTGIGLAVCKQIVEQFGGTIGITSEAGLGTTVTVSLPAGRRDKKDNAMGTKRSLRILLVDDEEITHQTLGDYLREAGQQVDGARDGRAALQAVEACHYDLALVDLQMPGIDGFSLVERLEKLRPEMPVVVITGHPDLEIAVRALRLGAADFLTKPVKLAELDAVLEKSLRLSGLRRDKRRLRGASEGCKPRPAPAPPKEASWGKARPRKNSASRSGKWSRPPAKRS